MRAFFYKSIYCINIKYKLLIRGLVFNVLFVLPLYGYSQILHTQGVPDKNKIIFSDEILVEMSFNPYVIDSMRNAFFETPAATTFAAKQVVNFSPENSGRVIKNESGEMVWYIRIRSEEAKSMNIIFSDFGLLEGEKVFVYDNLMKSLRGPFTWLNNKQVGRLAIMPVIGEEIIIEYHMKTPYRNNRLMIGQIAHDFIGIVGVDESKDIYYGNSQPCNVDINCESGSEWQLEKNSVVRIIADGTELGSGFLVNNTGGENIAFVITANHVIRSPEDAINSIYVFRYESPYCDGPDGLTDYTLSGAKMMAEDANTDFTIVRLDDFPPLVYKPYMAGWDVRDIVPERTITIHHPSGDVKKISTDNDPPVIATFQNLYQNGFWKVLQWDEGTTEGGSSGSPLFNHNHRVVGFLSGGEAVCGNSVNDYFARLDIAYDISTDIYESLKPWLDPEDSGILVLDGRDPYEDIKVDFDTLSNCEGDSRYLTEYSLPGTGYTTGFNSDSIIMYAEKFTVNEGMELTEVIMQIGDSKIIQNYDSITVYIMTGLTKPESVIARRSLFIKEARDSSDLYFDFFFPVPLPEIFYIAWQLWYREQALAEHQQFAVFHGAPVSIPENTAYFKDLIDWYPFYDHPNQSDALNLCVKAVIADSTVITGIDKIPGNAEIGYIYPNPVSEKLKIKTLAANHGEIRYSIIDNSGITAMEGYLHYADSGYVFELDVSALTPGIYFITLENEYSFTVYKFIRK